MRQAQNNRLGIVLMSATALVFAAQDGISRHLASEYNVFLPVTIRFWFFAVFVMILAARAPGGIRAAARSHFPALQITRGLLLALEVCVMVAAFVKLGLIASHAVFTSYPLMVAMLSGPILGEKVGWRRWTAILVGFVGILIILQPGNAVFSLWSLVPFAASAMFATYSLLTRYVARKDAASVSFFWTGVAGALALTPIGLWHWQPMTGADWGWMGLLCCTAALGHWLLIRAYEVAEASAIQPFGYLQLVFAALLALALFGETLSLNVAFGAGVVVAAGIFTLWRQRIRDRQDPPQTP